MTEPAKMDLQSMSITDEQKSKLKQLFPEAFNEDKIDFDKLRRTLGEEVDEGEERFGMTWPGRNECFRVIQEPSIAALKPEKDESVDWDNTENLFIEGDNLEVLKLLQRAYYEKIKMIYIDPPYNTGKDFIYPDKYAESLRTYLAYTGQVDIEGVKFSTNTEADGRFHSKWMNMMYPRLFLAKNLLKDGGILFVSIDDCEVDNLVRVCNDIFGEENHLGTITVVSNLKGRSDDKYFATAHNYLLAYSKGTFETKGVPIPDEYFNDYPEEDADGRRFRLLGLRKRGAGAKREDRPNMYYPIYADPNTGDVSLSKSDTYVVEILPRLSDGSDGRWRWGKDTTKQRIHELTSKTVGTEKRHDVFQIDYAENEEGVKRIKPKTVWSGPEFANETGTLEVKGLLGAKVFDNPKPIGLIRYCLEQSTSDSDIILDFFSGACTTAHAVLDLNNEDGGKRTFIMVQLPEPCEEGSEACKAGYKTIADIGKDRIRRAVNNAQRQRDQEAREIEETLPSIAREQARIDLGFKVFKLSKSSFDIWDGAVDGDQDLSEKIELFVDHIDPDSSDEDILYEILIKAGFQLPTKINELVLANKTVYSIAGNALLICLDRKLTKEVITEMAKLQPARVVCLDAGFANNDQLKTNAVQIMKSHEVEDFRTV